MRWIRDPLVHFVVVGGLLFGLARWLNPSASPEPVTVVLSAGDGAEREQMLTDEVLYREALRLGIGDGDVVIRRRLIQKMRFMLGDLAVAVEPTREELRAWFVAHADDYAPVARIDFVHRFFSTERRPDTAEADADAAQSDPEQTGDPFVHGSIGRNVGVGQLADWFGKDAAVHIFALPTGRWSAPIRSTFGWHLVRPDARRGGPPPMWDQLTGEQLAEIRADWLASQRAWARQQAIDAAIARYRVEFK